jgi:hypothetical protein
MCNPWDVICNEGVEGSLQYERERSEMEFHLAIGV